MSLPPFDTTAAPAYAQAPNPDWKFGQRVEDTPDGKAWVEAGEKAGWTVIDTATEDVGHLYKLMISGIVPRPVAFVSSVSENGVENLAPFSWFNMVTHYPPVISIAVANIRQPDRPYKDTAANIKATKNFVVNIISEPFINQANSTSVDTPANYSEWEVSGLTREPSIHVKSPRVKESAFSMECELYNFIDITHPTTGVATTSLVLGLVKYIHLRNDVLKPEGERGAGLVDPSKLKPIARLGDITYGTLDTLFRLPRPQWGSEQDAIKAAIAESAKEREARQGERARA